MRLNIFPVFQLEPLEEHVHLEIMFLFEKTYVVGVSKSFVLQVVRSVVDI